MVKKTSYTFLIDPELANGLKLLKAQTDVPESVSVRNAIRRYLEEKGALSAQKSTRRPKPSQRKK